MGGVGMGMDSSLLICALGRFGRGGRGCVWFPWSLGVCEIARSPAPRRPFAASGGGLKFASTLGSRLEDAMGAWCGCVQRMRRTSGRKSEIVDRAV